MAKTKPRTVACPTCGKPVEWGPQSPFRPFCSERCKKIDLGAWAAEEYRVPEQPGGGQLPEGEQ
ncbi:MAG: DNA gyrase inhibitor YacG [Pseudomonadota bacterium]